MTKKRNRICALEVHCDDSKLPECGRRDQDIAIAELLDESSFELVGRDSGPYRVTLDGTGAKLTIQVSDAEGGTIVSHTISFTPLKQAISNYAIACQALVKAACAPVDPLRIEAIDMSRRAFHNEGAEFLRERLGSKVRLDLETARQFFTLICLSRVRTTGVREVA